VVAVLNGGGGRMSRGEVGARAVLDAFAAAGIDAEVKVPSPDRLAVIAREAAATRPDVLVAGGGDGTIATVAGELLDGEVPLGVLPLGTFNRFATDLGVPAELAAAIGVLRSGERRRVDVAEVNGRVFLNTSTVGFGAAVVERRQDPRPRNRGGKAVATIAAALRTWPDFRSPLVRLRVDGEEVLRRTPLLAVTNNAGTFRFPHFGARQRLDGGTLHVAVLQRPHRSAVVRALVESVFRDLRDAPSFDHWQVTECEVDLGPRPVPVFLDGELLYLRSPLRYRIRAGALTVVAPPRLEQAAA
jgi:diacylglycerol kinase family enzyme